MAGRDLRDEALRALRDCTVIRVRRGGRFPGFAGLQREGLMTAQLVEGTDYVDCRLSPRGLLVVKDLPPTKGKPK